MKLEKPRGTTHARYTTADKRTGILDVKDLDCLQGVSCTITWLKGNPRKGYTELGKADFDGEYES